jgi:hypothetical protein
MGIAHGLGYLLFVWALTAGAVQVDAARAHDLFKYSLRNTSL